MRRSMSKGLGRLALLTGIVFLAALWLGPAALAAMPRGIIAGDAGGDTVIVRDGQQLPANRGEALYEGDILRGAGVSSLSIEWHPYAKGEMISGSEMKVVYAPPGTMDLAVYKVKEFFGFVDGEMRAQYAATRAPVLPAAGIGERYPLPGYAATVLPGQPATFAWGEIKGRALVVETGDKKVVFRKEVSGQKGVDMTPEEMGLAPGQAYVWRVEGLYDVFKLRVLDNDSARQVLDGLRTIDAGAGSSGEKLLDKAMFLQFASESNPQKLDLYWLSYRYLKAASEEGDKTVKEKAEHLLRRFDLHQESTR